MFTFNFTRTPSIQFGPGSFRKLLGFLKKNRYKSIFLITGGKSFRDSREWAYFFDQAIALNIDVNVFSVSGEPNPAFVDDTAEKGKEASPDCIVSIGGGSAVDAGKAVSAMIPAPLPVTSYLEGVGTEEPPGAKIPFIAVPTTSGTGSETTKNAVISKPGPEGFKKSLRHDNYVPDIAVVDPELTLSCPPAVTAASGLDAITQLLEGLVSTNASPMTDSLALSGLMAAGRAFPRAVEQGGTDVEARTHMAYAACMSGIVLANAGLGVVHGIAGYLGGRFDIPHGTACSTLLANASDMIINRLFDLEEENNVSLIKFAEAGKYLTGRDFGTVEDNTKALTELLFRWTAEYDIPGLDSFGITESHCSEIGEKSGLKNTPVELGPEDIRDICLARL